MSRVSLMPRLRYGLPRQPAAVLRLTCSAPLRLLQLAVWAVARLMTGWAMTCLMIFLRMTIFQWLPTSLRLPRLPSRSRW